MINSNRGGSYIQEADLDLLGSGSLGGALQRQNWSPIGWSVSYSFTGSYRNGRFSGVDPFT